MARPVANTSQLQADCHHTSMHTSYCAANLPPCIIAFLVQFLGVSGSSHEESSVWLHACMPTTKSSRRLCLQILDIPWMCRLFVKLACYFHFGQHQTSESEGTLVQYMGVVKDMLIPVSAIHYSTLCGVLPSSLCDEQILDHPKTCSPFSN